MMHMLMSLLVLVSSFFVETSGWVPNPEAVVPDNGYLEESVSFKEDWVTEGNCSMVYRFEEAALDPQGAAGTVPALVLLEAVYGLNDIQGVQREWLARCQEVHTEIADAWPDKQDTLEVTIEQTYNGQNVSGWSLHYMDFLEGVRGNYGTEYLILDQVSGEKVEWQTLVWPMDLGYFQATVEAFALGPEGAGLQISDSGLIDGVTPIPTGFLDQMSVGVSDEGLQIFGWLPEVLGTFPVAVTVPWDRVDHFSVTL